MLAKVPVNFELPDVVGLKGVVFTLPAGNVPTISWPNGRWCIEANMFLINLVQQQCSVLGNGGTVYTYATQLVHLIRFCALHNLDLHDMSDSDFSNFARYLKQEDTQKGPVVRDRTDRTVRQIGKVCLQFLEFVGAVHGIKNYVGPRGRIRVKREKKPRQPKESRTYDSSLSWVHRSLPNNSPDQTRGAISNQAVEKLKMAVVDSSSSHFLLKRRLTMIKMFNMTGCRREELVGIKVRDIKAALRLRHPMLKVPSIKRGGNRIETRLVPVTRSDLEFVNDFIEKNRRLVIRKTCGRPNDGGYVLIGETSGKKISAGYIAKELSKLRKMAGLKGRAHAHMFRHRFITKLFVQVLKLHDFKCKDDFRKALISTENLKRKILEWTGHRSTRSLSRYIDPAFSEASGSTEIMTKHFGDGG